MNILFLSLSKVWDINAHDIYSDLLREFMKNGDRVFVVTPVERRFGEKTSLTEQSNATILKVKTLNIQKTGIIEKGLGTVLLEQQFLSAIKRHFGKIRFDLVLYATPPVTLVKPIRYIKKRDHATTYLLLKDIFPQNALDLGMMTTGGVRGVLYKIFRKKELALYAVSDRIGCMSPANAKYLIRHNPQIAPETVEVCPNSMDLSPFTVSAEERAQMREKYGLPQDKTLFIYGGNLGKPQGIPFIIDCLNAEKDNAHAHFVIVGDGTEYGKLESFMSDVKPANVTLLKRLPKEDYDRMVGACDVGLIFLDHRFTIPNFPSRLLSYLQAGLPVLACTDPNTDIGEIITAHGAGWWCESNDVSAFRAVVDAALHADTAEMRGQISGLLDLYTVDKAHLTIINGTNGGKTDAQ